MTTSLAGWGENWGSNAWGDTSDGHLRLGYADVVAENVVRLVFNMAPYVSNIADRADGATAKRYTLTPVAATFGRDDKLSRPVTAATVLQNYEIDPTGATIDVTIDRPFSSYPAEYDIAVDSLVADSTRLGLDPAFTSFRFYGIQRLFAVPSPENAIPSRDIANPQTLAALTDSTGSTDGSQLGTYPVDQTGDYATDQGVHNLKKRVYRRVMTSVNAFAHAPGYGVGVADYGKKLNIPSVREQVAVNAEAQISQEPDVLKCKVRAIVDPAAPDVCRFVILIQTIGGLGVKYEIPFRMS